MYYVIENQFKSNYFENIKEINAKNLIIKILLIIILSIIKLSFNLIKFDLSITKEIEMYRNIPPINKRNRNVSKYSSNKHEKQNYYNRIL